MAAATRRAGSGLGMVFAQAAVLALIGAGVGLADSKLRPVRLGMEVRAGSEPARDVPPVAPLPDAPDASATPSAQVPPTTGPAATPEPAPSPSTAAAQPVAAAAAAFRPTTEAELAGKPGHITLQRGFDMHQFMGAIFLDARNADEFAAGHIEGAHLAPLSRFRRGDVPEVLTMAQADFPIVVYCGGGDDCQASEDVALHLNSVGFFNVHVLHDGFTGWQAVGYPVETGGPR